MSRYTKRKILRQHAGTFTEKAEFIPQHVPMPRRYRCSCNPNGFVAGQAINHFKFCPFHNRNIEAFLNVESTIVQFIVLVLVAALCSLACIGLIASIQTL